MVIAKTFELVADSIAQMNPQEIIKLKAPLEMSERVEILVNRKKNNKISPEESNELERFLALDMFIGLTKAKARQHLHA